MPRVGTGSIIPKTLTDGSCAYELRFLPVVVASASPSTSAHGAPAGVAVAGRAVGPSRARRHRRARPRGGLDVTRPPGGGAGRRRGTVHSDVSPVRVAWLEGKDRGHARRQADRRQHHSGLLPLAPRPPSASVLRARTGSTRSTASSASPSRPTRSGGRRAADRDRRRRRPPRPSRPQVVPLGTVVDPQADRHARRDPRRRRRGRSHRPQPGARQAHARPRAQACPRTFLETRRAAGALRAARRRTAPRCSPRCRGSGARTRAKVGVCSRREGHDARSRRTRPREVDGQHTTCIDASASGTRPLLTWVRARRRVLGRSGVRVSELCDVRIRHVRLHDPGARASTSRTQDAGPASESSR